jgi:hypothetical protein
MSLPTTEPKNWVRDVRYWLMYFEEQTHRFNLITQRLLLLGVLGGVEEVACNII